MPSPRRHEWPGPPPEYAPSYDPERDGGVPPLGLPGHSRVEKHCRFVKCPCAMRPPKFWKHETGAVMEIDMPDPVVVPIEQPIEDRYVHDVEPTYHRKVVPMAEAVHLRHSSRIHRGLFSMASELLSTTPEGPSVHDGDWIDVSRRFGRRGTCPECGKVYESYDDEWHRERIWVKREENRSDGAGPPAQATPE